MSGPAPLASCPAEQLRGERLGELFELIAVATNDTAPLVTTLVRRAFEGAAGLEALRADATLPFLIAGLGHADDEVRALTIAELCRLVGSETPSQERRQEDLALLAARALLPKLAIALSDQSLRVAQQASRFFVACAAAGDETLAAILDDKPTAAALAAGASQADSTLALRTLASLCEMAVTGEPQFKRLCGASAPIEAPLLALWRGADELLRLNALELFAVLSRHCDGFGWLVSRNVVTELLLALDPPSDGERGLMREVQMPALLHCFSELIENGGASAAALLLTQERVIDRSWHFLSGSSEIRDGALVLLRAAVISGGSNLVLMHGDSGGADPPSLEPLKPLPSLLTATDPRARIAAFALLEALCEGAASDASNGGVTTGSALEGGRPTARLRLLVAAVSPRGGLAAGDALAQIIGTPYSDMRTASLRLLVAIASLGWGALELAGCERVLEVLLYAAPNTQQLSSDDLRLKHALATKLAESPQAISSLGPESGSVRHLREFVAGGPFFTQPPSAPQPAGPLTL